LEIQQDPKLTIQEKAKLMQVCYSLFWTGGRLQDTLLPSQITVSQAPVYIRCLKYIYDFRITHLNIRLMPQPARWQNRDSSVQIFPVFAL
jgi:hypothetical protein